MAQYAKALCTRCRTIYVPQWGTAGSCPVCGNGRPWWGVGKPIATPGNYGQPAHTPTPRRAHKGQHYRQAATMVLTVQQLHRAHVGAQVTTAARQQYAPVHHAQAVALMAQAQQVAAAAYAAGRGYAPTVRCTNYVYKVANSVATATNGGGCSA